MNREHVKQAIVRLQTALKYGDDMKSSALLCISDAVELLQVCDACKGCGWLVLRQWGASGGVDGAWGIERCDTCQELTDIQANCVPEARAELERRTKETV